MFENIKYFYFLSRLLVAKLWVFLGKQIEDYVHQYPKTSDIGTFMSKYENRLIRLAFYNNNSQQHALELKLRFFLNPGRCSSFLEQ